MKEKVIEMILRIIRENDIEIEIDEINESTSLNSDLGLDSFNLAQLTVEIESEFGVDIFEKGLISKVGDILNQIKANDILD
jgi:acyl carrier protein